MLPIPAESYTMYKKEYHDDGSNFPALVAPLKAHEWTLMFYHEDPREEFPKDESVNGQTSLRHAFVTVDENGSFRVLQTEEFLQQGLPHEQAKKLHDNWNRDMAKFCNRIDRTTRDIENEEQWQAHAASFEEVEQSVEMIEAYKSSILLGQKANPTFTTVGLHLERAQVPRE